MTVYTAIQELFRLRQEDHLLEPGVCGQPKQVVRLILKRERRWGTYNPLVCMQAI